MLPLPADVGLVGVFGRLADRINLGDGGSSDVWDLDCHTALDGLRATLGDVVHDDGTDLERATTIAAGTDVAVVVVGYTYEDEGEFIGATDPSLPAMFPDTDEPEVVERFQTWLSSLPATEKPARIGKRPQGFSHRRGPRVAPAARRATSSSSGPSPPRTLGLSW